MKAFIPWFAATVVTATVAVMPVFDVLACSCVPPPPPGEAASQADAVFEARVESVEEMVRPPGAGDDRPLGRNYRLAVTRAWKGVHAGEEITLWTGLGHGDCGFRFELSGTYLVYAYRLSGDTLTTNLCTRTRTLADASEDLAALGLPVSTGSPARPSPSSAARTVPTAPASSTASTTAGMTVTRRTGCATCTVRPFEQRRSLETVRKIAPMGMFFFVRRRKTKSGS